MDGVLSDFNAHYEALTGKPIDKSDRKKLDLSIIDGSDFFKTMPPTSSFHLIQDHFRHLPNPVVLTGLPVSDIENAIMNKRRWLNAHWGNHISMIACLSKDKHLHCKPGDILIDDWNKYEASWVAKGGIFIHYTSYQRSFTLLDTILRFTK